MYDYTMIKLLPESSIIWYFLIHFYHSFKKNGGLDNNSYLIDNT
jgi:hypothetical protein